MVCTTWRFWMRRQPNGCSTPAPRSSAAKQWLEELTQKKKTADFPIAIRSFHFKEVKSEFLCQVETNGDVCGAKLVAETFCLKCHLERHLVDIFKRVVETDEAKTSQTTGSNAVCKQETSKFVHFEKVAVSITKPKFEKHLIELVVDRSCSVTFAGIYEVTWRNGWQTGCVIRTRSIRNMYRHRSGQYFGVCKGYLARKASMRQTFSLLIFCNSLYIMFSSAMLRQTWKYKIS